jgi:hypothetical protein
MTQVRDDVRMVPPQNPREGQSTQHRLEEACVNERVDPRITEEECLRAFPNDERDVSVWKTVDNRRHGGACQDAVSDIGGADDEHSLR